MTVIDELELALAGASKFGSDADLEHLGAVILRNKSLVLNPCAKIFDHKWLDPKCVNGGCQSLVLADRNDKLEKQLANKRIELDTLRLTLDSVSSQRDNALRELAELQKKVAKEEKTFQRKWSFVNANTSPAFLKILNSTFADDVVLAYNDEVIVRDGPLYKNAKKTTVKNAINRWGDTFIQEMIAQGQASIPTEKT
jgi:hypothetical protein